MDLHAAENSLKDYFENSVKIEYNVEREEELLSFFLGVVIDAYDDPIDLSIRCNNNGVLLIYAQFDKFGDPKDAYELINTFNLEQPIFKAYVNDDGRLELQFTALEISNEQLIRTVDFVITRLLEEPFVGLLRPLTELTE